MKARAALSSRVLLTDRKKSAKLAREIKNAKSEREMGVRKERVKGGLIMKARKGTIKGGH